MTLKEARGDSRRGTTGRGVHNKSFEKRRVDIWADTKSKPKSGEDAPSLLPPQRAGHFLDIFLVPGNIVVHGAYFSDGQMSLVSSGHGGGHVSHEGWTFGRTDTFLRGPLRQPDGFQKDFFVPLSIR